MQTMLRYIKNKHIQNKIQRLTKQKQSIAPRVKQTKNKLNRKVIKEKKHTVTFTNETMKHFSFLLKQNCATTVVWVCEWEAGCSVIASVCVSVWLLLQRNNMNMNCTLVCGECEEIPKDRDQRRTIGIFKRSGVWWYHFRESVNTISSKLLFS